MDNIESTINEILKDVDNQQFTSTSTKCSHNKKETTTSCKRNKESLSSYDNHQLIDDLLNDVNKDL